MNSLLGELKIKRNAGPVIWVDNLRAIALASNPVMHARTKHIELGIHFIIDKVLGKEIELRHVPTADQIADIFTRPLSKQSFVKLRERLGVVSLASLGLRGCVREVYSEQTGVACNAELNVDDPSHCRVSKLGARDRVKIVPLPTGEDQRDVVVLPNKSEDQKYTWRELLKH